MYSLNADPNMPHHYIVSVCMKELSLSKNPGELFMKYRPIYLNHDDIVNIQNAVLLSNDKLFKTNKADAIKIHNCQEIVSTLSGLRISTMANKGSLHHFFTTHKLEAPESFFDDFVKRANTHQQTRNKLMSSMMKIFG